MDSKLYTYRVFWSEDDQEFVGRCVEFPSLSWLDEEQGKALEGIVQLVTDTIQDMQSNGEKIPMPMSKKSFSGKISFRTTPETHRALALDAAEQGVSLNRHINSLIAR